MTENVDLKVVEDFGREWAQFQQNTLKTDELQHLFNAYFQIFPWEKLSNNPIGFDMGCGSGRWASIVATKVAKLYCIDASKTALNVARKNLHHVNNVDFIEASVHQLPLADNSMDFAYSLGVLHHIPDTQAGIKACVDKLKPGAPLLLYLYYAFDNKPKWFQALWNVSNLLRNIIAKMPFRIKYIISQVLAATIYFPLARCALLLEKMGMNVAHFPLSAYRRLSFYTMRTDALDRFGTRLEHRYTREQITTMMQASGLEQISFNNDVPYWCAVGFKKKSYD